MLWGGWVIAGSNNKKVYFVGETGMKIINVYIFCFINHIFFVVAFFLGYCPVFKDIGKKFGSIDYSFIPIGAYEPR